MQFKTVWAVYYSGSGSTRRLLRGMAEAAGEALMLPVRELDYSRPEAREKSYCFTETDLVFWGSPTYAGRLPNVLLPFLRGNFTGGGAAAVAVVLYGNRSYDDALKELCEVLTGNGFLAAAGAAVTAEHAFAPALAHGRPNGEDRAAAAEFARKTALTLWGEGTPHPRYCARPGAHRGVLYPAGARWRAGTLFEGQAQNRPRAMHPLRALCGGLPHGLHPAGGADRVYRHLHQMSGLHPGMSGRRQIF